MREEKLYIVDRKKVRSRSPVLPDHQLTVHRNSSNTMLIKLHQPSSKPYYSRILSSWMLLLSEWRGTEPNCQGPMWSLTRPRFRKIRSMKLSTASLRATNGSGAAFSILTRYPRLLQGRFSERIFESWQRGLDQSYRGQAPLYTTNHIFTSILLPYERTFLAIGVIREHYSTTNRLSLHP